MTSALELRQVSKIYGSGPAEVHALREVDLSVEAGELVAVMGPSGSGKSTLLTIAGSLETPTSGQVLVDGVDIAAVTRSDRAKMRRRSIGYVFQDFNLLPGLTALENVTLPLELDGVGTKDARATGLDAMAALDVAESADRYPDELSGGQRQRVAIARAIVGERGLLLADEPTGALDSVNGEAVMRLLRSATRARSRRCRGHPRSTPRVLGRPRGLHPRRPPRRPDRRATRPRVPAGGRRPAMTTLAHREPLRGPKNGGVAARRALIRWAGRLFRREWRQQVLVLTLLAVAVAAAICSITIVHNADPATRDPELGSANALLRFDGSDPRQLEAGLVSARRAFGTIDAVAHRSVVVPGSVEVLDYRAQDPGGAYGDVLLALRRGSYPTGPGEVAVTDGVADLLRLEIGSTLELDGRRRQVVGIVENPRKLSDEFALVSPSSTFAAEHVSVLVDTSTESLESFFGPGSGSPPAFSGAAIAGNDHPEAPTLAMFSVTTVFLLLASLVAAAGFAVVAQRRLRQLGMLAAVGATQKQVRLVLLANGAIVGSIAAILGTTAGLAAWLVFAPSLESALDHRVDRLVLPWWLIATTILLAIVGATAAAWWPGRAAARLPVVLALSGRPPKPRPARHSAIAAVALIAVGVGCLALSDRSEELLIIAGIVTTIVGCLLLGPLAIRAFSRPAGLVPIAPRLALRDLVRYQARSGAALAAVTLALGIAATIVVIASAEEAKSAAEPPNLSDRQIRVYLGPPEARELTPVDALAQLDRLGSSVRQLAAQLDDAAVIPLRKAMQPQADRTFIGNTEVFLRSSSRDDSTRPPAESSTRANRSSTSPRRPCSGTLGVDPTSIDPGTDFILDRSVRADGLVIPSMRRRDDTALTNVQRIDVGEHLFGSASSGSPANFVTLGALRRHGWKHIPAGWLVESSRPLTSDQIADAREVAAAAGVTIEVQHTGISNARVMAIATAAGGILALAILAMTVGLIRSESAGDLRTLTATGASPRIRRTLTSTTAGALALLGALLGVAGAYVVMLATYHDDLGYLSHVPILYLALAVAGVPLAAAAAGWLLAGREPPAIAKPVIE